MIFTTKRKRQENEKTLITRTQEKINFTHDLSYFNL